MARILSVVRPTLADLLRAPALVDVLRPVGDDAGPASSTAVTSVAFLDEVAGLAAAREGALVILGARASVISGYRLDLTARLAVDRGVSALVLLASEPLEIGSSTLAIARNGDMGLLRCDPGIDIAELVLIVDRELRGGADRALARVHAVLTLLQQMTRDGAPLDVLTGAVGGLLDTPVALRDASVDDVSATLVLDGQSEGTLAAAAGDRCEAQAREIALELTAAAIARIAEHNERRHDAPGQTHESFLTEFIAVDGGRVERLIDRARAIGLQLDGWHSVMRFELEEVVDAADGDEASTFELARSAMRVAMSVAREAGGVWHRARAGSGLLLIKTERRDPNPRGPRTLVTVAGQIIERIHAHHPEVRVRCGIGAAHGGAGGLRRSANEAHTALATARGTDDTEVACFDAMGMRRILVEWAASTTARDTIDMLLNPLDELGPRRSAEAIRTLRAYLDNHGSLVRAAASLHLHRNSLAYRLAQIRERLLVDLDDPEQWLALQLACHARLLD